MKRRISIYVAALSIPLLFATSCSDQLQLAPVSSIGVEGFWRTPEQATGGVNSMYHRLRAYTQNLYMLGSARSEEMGWTQSRNPSWKIKYFENTLTAANADLDWQTPYKVIGLANLVIENVPNITFTNQARKNSYLAQAYAMRAYMYFVLAKAWGDVPLELAPVEGYDPETTFKVRTPVAEIFAQIKSDIESALELFPDNQFPSHRATWSRPAVNALKGDVYLWTGKVMGGGNSDITTALEALRAVQTANVGLVSNFANVFDYGNKGNQEIIMSIHFNLDEVSNSHYARMYALAGHINAGGPDAQARFLPEGGGWWGPSEHIVAKFQEKDDPRADASIAVLPSVLMIPKFKGTVHEGNRRFVDDVILYRYADVLLLIAEAKNALGQDPSPEVNMVRERAYGEDFSAEHAFVSGSREANDDAILEERLFELAFEGKRWWDLVRFGKAYELVPSLQGRTNVSLLLPLDEETLTRNSRLTQTSGY